MGHLFKINRSQLYLAHEKGGLGLIDVGNKIKALFIRNVLYSSAKNGSVPSQDFLFKNRNKLKLGRTYNTYIKDAENLVRFPFLNCTKQIYLYLIDSMQIHPVIELKNTNIVWQNIWTNLNMKFIDSNLKTVLYYYVNGIVPTRSKLFKNNIRGTEDNTCKVCGKVDDAEHRLKTCKTSINVWNFVQEVIKKKLRIPVADPTELLDKTISRNNEKLGLWIVVNAISYNLKHFTSSNVMEFQQIINEGLYQRTQYFEKEFGNYVSLIK